MLRIDRNGGALCSTTTLSEIGNNTAAATRLSEMIRAARVVNRRAEIVRLDDCRNAPAP